MSAIWHEHWQGSRVTCDGCGREAFFQRPVMRWLIRMSEGGDPLTDAGWTYWQDKPGEDYQHHCPECRREAA